jgi:phosphate-selective porin
MNNYWSRLSLGKNHKLMVGASWSYENLIDAGTRDVEARAQGVHTLGEKIQDGALSNINDYSYGGPQFAYTNGPLFMAGEWMYVTADREETTISAARTARAYGDYQATGGSFFAHYFLTGGTTVPLSAKKGKIGGVKCKGKFGCTAIKVMYEQWNGAHSELSTTGTDAKVIHFGLNHYFNNNVRLMIDGARGLYINGTGLNSDALGSNHEGNLTSIQARLHFKW